MIKCKEDFQNCYIDLSNKEINGEVTEEMFEKLKECCNKILNNKFACEGINTFSSLEYYIYLDKKEYAPIFYMSSRGNRIITNLVTEYLEDFQEVSIYDIQGMNKEDFKKEENVNNVHITWTKPLEGHETICVAKGSRLWAFAMLDRGAKIRQSNWLIAGSYLCLNEDNKIVDEDDYEDPMIFFKDGWELYEESKTMTLREAIEQKVKFKWKFDEGDFIEVDGNELAEWIEVKTIINDLDKEVEIVEE